MAPPRTAPAARLDRLNHLAGRPIATIDMDGTCYDPWACCGNRGNWRSSPTCTHIRTDILDDIEATLARTGAAPVVLSYRAGLNDITIDWLADINVAVAGHTDTELTNPRFTIEAIFTPGSPDDISTLSPPRTTGAGQARFKAAIAEALRDQLSCTLAAAWDDNREVVDTLAAVGVERPTLAPHKVKIAPHEFHAGYLGAPKAPPLPPRPPTPTSPNSSYQPTLDLDLAGQCEWCGQPAWDDWLCALCADADATHAPADYDPTGGHAIGDLVILPADSPDSDQLCTVVAHDELDGLVIRDLDTGELLWVDADTVITVEQ